MLSSRKHDLINCNLPRLWGSAYASLLWQDQGSQNYYHVENPFFFYVSAFLNIRQERTYFFRMASGYNIMKRKVGINTRNENVVHYSYTGNYNKNILCLYCQLCYMVVKHGLLIEECRLRVFENRILRRIFGPKRDENREWRRLQNEEFHSLYRSPNIFRMI